MRWSEESHSLKISAMLIPANFEFLLREVKALIHSSLLVKSHFWGVNDGNAATLVSKAPMVF